MNVSEADGKFPVRFRFFMHKNIFSANIKIKLKTAN